MIEEWSIGAFKSVQGNEKLKLAPLTVFAGPNSSGKSTIIQSMLLLRQTLSNKIEHRQLVLNGDLVRLGALDDVVSSKSESRNISIGFRLRIDPDVIRADTLRSGLATSWFYFAPVASHGIVDVDLKFGSEGETNPLQATLVVAIFKCIPNAPERPVEKYERAFPNNSVSIRRRSDEEVAALAASVPEWDGDRTALHYEVKVDGAGVTEEMLPYRVHPMQASALDVVGVVLEHFLPRLLMNRFRLVDEVISNDLSEISSLPQEKRHAIIQEWRSSDSAVRRGISQAFSDNPAILSDLVRRSRGASSDAVREAARKIADSVPDASRKSIAFVPPTDAMSLIGSSVMSEFSKVRYLGPLRDEPKPLYEIARSTDPKDVGMRGENTAAVLDLHRESMVEFVCPVSGEMDKRPLLEAVTRWVKHLGIADALTTNDAGKLGHKLHVRPEGIEREVDLTNVGVGASQVLPILVMALVSDPGSVLLLEQPELHLHPRVQSLLADFFLGVVRSGRQCIIETHSEYLLNRLRLRVAESPIDSALENEILIYFVQRISGVSRYQEVRINTYGAIPSWPDGFFDQGPDESDRILEAASRKRALMKGGRR